MLNFLFVEKEEFVWVQKVSSNSHSSFKKQLFLLLFLRKAFILVLNSSLVGLLNKKLKQPSYISRILTLSAMSAGLSAFLMNPLAGTLFSLEVPHRSGMEYYECIQPALLSSIFSVALKLAITSSKVEPLFFLPQFPSLINISSFLYATALGALCGFIVALFVLSIQLLRKLFKCLRVEESPLLFSLVSGVLIGFMCALLPQNLFWSEDELSNVVSLGMEPIERLPSFMQTGIIPIHAPFSSLSSLLISLMKFACIALSVSVGMPGGIIFPLFFASASFANFLSGAIPGVNRAATVACLMVSVEASVTRTLWGTALIVLFASNGEKESMIGYFGPVICCGFVSMFFTQRLHYFGNEVQKGRVDYIFHENEGYITTSSILQVTTPLQFVDLSDQSKQIEESQNLQNSFQLQGEGKELVVGGSFSTIENNLVED